MGKEEVFSEPRELTTNKCSKDWIRKSLNGSLRRNQDYIVLDLPLRGENWDPVRN